MASLLTILEKLLPFVASIRTSAPLTGCPAGSLTTPSKADVPPEALKAKRNKPTKLILYDLRNIPAFYGFLANKSSGGASFWRLQLRARTLHPRDHASGSRWP